MKSTNAKMRPSKAQCDSVPPRGIVMPMVVGMATRPFFGGGLYCSQPVGFGGVAWDKGRKVALGGPKVVREAGGSKCHQEFSTKVHFSFG